LEEDAFDLPYVHAEIVRQNNDNLLDLFNGVRYNSWGVHLEDAYDLIKGTECKNSFNQTKCNNVPWAFDHYRMKFHYAETEVFCKILGDQEHIILYRIWAGS